MPFGKVLNGPHQTVSCAVFASATERIAPSRPCSVTCGGVKPRFSPARMLAISSSK